MSSSTPQEVLFVNRPSGHPDASTFKIQPIASPPTSASSNGLLLQLVTISVDPYLRGVQRSAPLNAPLSSYCVAKVLDSQLSDYSKGDLVTGVMPWRTVQAHEGKGLRKINSSANIPHTAYIGVCGMPGLTAYFGLLDQEVGRFKPGQTVVVSGAAGAVGSLVGQLAKLKGAKRVIGTAGGADKCKLVKEKYGFDECLDYKALSSADAMTSALKSAAPDGVDLYFDNTGGHVTQAVFENFNKFGRMALCGAISTYNNGKEELVPNFLGLKAIYGSLTIRGFTVSDFVKEFDKFYAEVPALVEQGKIKFDETKYQGLEKLPEAFAGLFQGHNTGKAVVVLE